MLYLRRAKFRTRAIPQSVFDERYSRLARDKLATSPVPIGTTHQRINAASNRSCRFIFRNASPLSSVRIESKPLGSSVVRIRMQIRRVCRRSLLRFNGRIKLIQIYIPEQDTHGRTHGKSERVRRGRFSTDCATHGYSIVSRELGLHGVGVDLSFLSPGERYPNKRDRDTSPLLPARRRGQSLPRVARDLGRVALVDMALSRLTFPDIMEPLMPYEQAAALRYASLAPILA